MPSTTSLVGGLTLPVAAGATNATLADPVIVGLLDFLGWMLETELNAKLATQTDLAKTACPSANRFAWNPLEPTAHKAKLPIPGLWMWQHESSRLLPFTTVLARRQRTLRLLYLAEETPRETGHARRAGLLAAVDAVFCKASDWQRHPSYGYGSSADGTPLYQSLAELGTFAWRYVGGSMVRFGIDGGPPVEVNVSEKSSGRDFPGLVGVIEVDEVVGSGTMSDPADVLVDGSLVIDAGDGETGEVVDDFLTRALDAPDGSEDL